MERRLNDNAFGEREWDAEAEVAAQLEADAIGLGTPEQMGARQVGSPLHPARIDWVVPEPGGGSALARRARREHGVCLYFGPMGERCERAAMEGGFCARHRASAPKARLAHRMAAARAEIGQEEAANEGEVGPDPSAGPLGAAKKIAAILLAGAALWPVLADLLKELLRNLR